MGEKILKTCLDKWWLWISLITVLFFTVMAMINSECSKNAKIKSQLIVDNIKNESVSYDKESRERRINELMLLCERLNNSSYTSDNLPEGVEILEGENIPDEFITLFNNPDETYMEKVNFDGSVYCYAAKACTEDSIIVCYEDVTGKNMTYAEFTLKSCKDRLNLPPGYGAVITDGKNVLTATDISYENITEEEFLEIINRKALWNSEAVKYRNYYIYIIAERNYVNVPDIISTAVMTIMYVTYMGIYLILKYIYVNRKKDDINTDIYKRNDKDSRNVYGNGELFGKNILLFENNEFSMGITQCILEKNGANVVKASNDNMAVEIFDKSDKEYFSMVILDVTKNITDCLYICTQIRGLSRKDADSVPVLAMTASAGKVSMVSERYVSGWILKPVNEKTLMAKIKGYIG